MSRREFQFVEGTSKKFWAITLSGSQFTVEWGRIGTAGQTQVKAFGSDSDAKKQSDKLIAEKTGKGYTEVSGGTATTATVKVPVKTTPAPAVVTSAAAPAAEQATPPPPARPAKQAASKPATQSPPVAFPAERRLNLDPADWHWATWCETKPLPKPEPRLFALADCLARLLKLKRNEYGWMMDWSAAAIKPGMSPQEVHFWLTAVDLLRSRDRENRVSTETVATRMQTMTFSGDVQVELFEGVFHDHTASVQVAVTALTDLLLRRLSMFDQLFDLLEHTGSGQSHYLHHSIAEFDSAFRQQVLPYLDEAERAQLRDKLRPHIKPDPQLAGKRCPLQYFLAAALGMHAEIQAVVSAIPDDAYAASNPMGRYQRPLELVLGLGSAAEVESHARRLKLVPYTPDQVRAWLATTQTAALDVILASILPIGKKEDAQKMVEALALAESPEVAPVMLQLQLESKAPRAAREWLDTHPAHAVSGLIPVAAGRGKLADAAAEFLEGIKRKGQADLIRAAMADQPADIQAKITADILERTVALIDPLTDADTPAWLVAAVDQASAQRSKLPSWIDPGALPQIILDVAGGSRRLNDDQTRTLCMALQKNDLAKPHPLIASLKQHAQRESLDKFAWKLFEGWVADGAPSKEKWALMAIGAIGGDGCVLKITPLIRAWPGESQHQRAVAGLECLRVVGTDTALMALNGISQKLKFKGLKAKAMEMMEAIAADRKMTRSELEDRIVPDCDLDEKGSRIFDFGPRQFRFVLGPEMKPMLKDADNKVRGDLPAPNAKDDQAKATVAVESWKVLKKMVKEVAKVQAVRLEQSMVTGRRWDAASFDLLLVKHPLMTNLARLLVWGGYDDKGILQQTFRITEDQTYANDQDDTCKLDGINRIGIAHPAHMNDQQRQKWGEILSDYELIPPFRQLGRTVYRLEGDEPQAREITRFKDTKVEALILVGMLERMAWQRGVPQDAGVVHEHSKPFYGADVTAVLEYEIGVPVGYMEGWEDQRLTRCFFVPGIYTPTMYPQHKDALQLSQVDHVVVSEVLRDLNAIASKTK